ncbi:MAG TPA: ADOP family duplicated permease [Gemmatimonadaceae bacterium]|nr:ADOP family duplicated permease [Gemmatimonadaceae bacterium]
MTPRELVGRIAAWWRRDALARELSDELEEHVRFLARDFEHEGMAPADALAAARRQVGNIGRLKEESRDAWGIPALEALTQDLRYAVRGLRRSPGFTAIVIITLALGIGANTAMFAVIDRMMFRPFPLLRAPAEVHRVYLQTTYQGRTNANPLFPFLRYRDLAAAARTVAAVAAHSEWRFAVGDGDAAAPRKVVGVTPSFFRFFDAPPVLGRYFAAAEDSGPAGVPVAVVSHRFWSTELDSANVIGQRLKVGVVDYTIVGVAPNDFVGVTEGAPPDIFVPLATIPTNLGEWSQGSFRRDYSWDWVQMIVRRNPGVTVEEVSDELTAAYVRSRAAARAINPRVLPDSLVHPVSIAGPVKLAAGPDAGAESRVLLWVTGVAAIVLVIACANVANLMIARVIRRRREITVRLALGVGRGRLVAQFLTEAMLLAILGGAAGVVAAQWAGAAIRAMLLPEGTPFNLATDWRTLGVSLGCATVAALVTAIGPALAAARTDLAASLKAGVREGTVPRNRTRELLVVAQGALSVLLLVGAALFVRSVVNARSVPLGYDVRPVIEVVTDFRGYAMDSATAVGVRRKLLADVQALPGVVAAARVNSRLFGTNTAQLRVESIDSVEALGRFNFQMTTPDYFRVMQTRILRGRAFTDADGDAQPLVAVVSDAMARALWPGQDPLGQCIRVGLGANPSAATAPCTTVIGVAENTAQQNITDDPRFMYYLPVAQVAPHELSTIYVRMARPDARGELDRVRREVTRAMPGDGFAVVRPLQDVVDNQTRSWRLGATLFVAFGGLALAVAIVGLYGVMSYSVTQRMHELGVRIALGARSSDIVRLVVVQALRPVSIAVAIGLAVAWLVAPRVQPLLFRQSAVDVATYAGVGGMMLLAAVFASVIPAARAARADPSVGLRAD